MKKLWIALLLLAVLLTGCQNSTDGKLYLSAEEAYAHDGMTVYSAFAEEAGSYPLTLEGGTGADFSVMVNGLPWDGTWQGKDTEIPLNRGINSIQLTALSEEAVVTGIYLEGLSREQEAGAQVLYTAYEAEQGETNAQIQSGNREYRTFTSEASERSYVELKNTGDYVSVTLEKPANALVIRYAIPDSADGAGLDTTAVLQVGDDSIKLPLTSRYTWVYGEYPWNNDPSTAEKSGGGHHFFDDVRMKLDKVYPAGTVITITKDTATNVDYCLIDLIEAEEVGDPLPMPENALNVVDFGAIPDDDIDDSIAIENCIKAATAEGKEVFIPAGEFLIQDPFYVKGFVLNDDNVVIRGAGMWHTTLHGAASGFSIRASHIAFYDFSLVGEVTARNNSTDPCAMDMTTITTGMRDVRIQNIWIEHYKVGLWADVTNGISMMGCRIRNTFADGVNLCGGTSNSVITQNDIRNTGDDAIAMFCRGVVDENNKVTWNTIALPWLANHIALYGGKDILVSHNLCKDTIVNGGGVNISTNFTPQVFEGKILVEDNVLLRTGGQEYDITCGAIWMNTVGGYDNTAECIIQNNTILDSTYYGMSFHNTGTLENMVIENNTITGGLYGYRVFGEAIGSATIRNNEVSDMENGELLHEAEGQFTILEK